MRAQEGRAIDDGFWDPLVRAHDRSVRLSLLALGLRPERAAEIAQAAWMRLVEKHRRGELEALELPGLAIRQARFLALDLLRRDRAEMELAEAAKREAPQPQDPVARLAGRQELDRVAAALAARPASARAVFALLYGRGQSPEEAAGELGLSLQRVRQIVCETRKAIREALEEAP